MCLNPWAACLSWSRPLLRAAALGLLACSPRLAPQPSGEAAVLRYVAEHRGELEQQARSGAGPAVLGLARQAACQDVPALGRRLRRERVQVFSEPQATATEGDTAAEETPGQRILAMLQDHPELRCTDLDRGPGRLLAPGRRLVLGFDRGRGPGGLSPNRIEQALGGSPR